jgi:hypothetical protein
MRFRRIAVVIAVLSPISANAASSQQGPVTLTLQRVGTSSFASAPMATDVSGVPDEIDTAPNGDADNGTDLGVAINRSLPGTTTGHGGPVNSKPKSNPVLGTNFQGLNFQTSGLPTAAISSPSSVPIRGAFMVGHTFDARFSFTITRNESPALTKEMLERVRRTVEAQLNEESPTKLSNALNLLPLPRFVVKSGRCLWNQRRPGSGPQVEHHWPAFQSCLRVLSPICWHKSCCASSFK